MPDVLTHEERRTYQSGIVDCLNGRAPLSAVLALAGRHDLQIPYIRGWMIGERLLADDDPFGNIDEAEGEQYD